MNEEALHNSFTQLYSQHTDEIFRFCVTKVRNRDIALDLTQDTFIAVWDYITKKKELEYPRALLYRIARNKIIDWSRKKKASSLDHLMEAGIEFGVHNEFENIVTKDDMRTLLHHIDKLDESYKEVLIMRYLDGLSVKEIAGLLQEQPNAVSVRIHRGLEKVRTAVENV